MAITKVQSISGNGATITLNGVTAGNLLTLQTSYFRGSGTGAAETTPTDTNGTWAVAVAPACAEFSGGSVDVGASIFYCKNAASGTHTVTPQANSGHWQTLVEWSGMDTTAPLDVSTHSETSASAHTSRSTGTTAATAQNDELVLIGCAVGASGGANPLGNAGTTFGSPPVSGFTDLKTVNNDLTDIATQHEYKIVAATGTQSATFTWTASEAAMASQGVIATFKAAAGATPAEQLRLMVLGVGA